MVIIDKKKLKEKRFQSIDNDISKIYLLYLLDALNEKPINSKTKLMKELFFISKNVPDLEKTLKFEADNYGPSSDVVERQITTLSQEDFLKIQGNSYFIGDLGKEYLKEKKHDINKSLIERMKELFDNLTNNETLALTYSTYPEYTNESLVKDAIKKDRKKLALNLYKKNKISLEKACEIAELNIHDFLKILKKRLLLGLPSQNRNETAEMRKSMKNRREFKTIVSLLLCIALLCAFAPAAYAQAGADAATLSIVATVFPAYDFARALAGDKADVKLLLPPGSESHSYEPTPQDVIAIQSADLFVYVGGESDTWVESILDSMGEEKPRVFRLMDCVTAVAEESSQSMEGEGGADGATEYDEHVWTSPKNAMLIVNALCDALCDAQPTEAEGFRASCDAYEGELQKLDEAFAKVVAEGKLDVIVFGDRFPFRYFVDAYGLRYDAAFPGCSEDSEPSVKTVMSLVEQIRAEGVPVIFYIEFSSRKTADTLAAETGAKELLFHSCHNVSAQELQDGATYLSLMWANVDALREALS